MKRSPGVTVSSERRPGRWPELVCFLWCIAAAAAVAHEPLFMMSHEAPGKGASDLHVALHGERGETEDETEFELEFTRGLTRNLAVKVGVPLVRREQRSAAGIAGDTGIGDPTVRAKWRFWDRDVLGAKYAVAAMLQSTVPVGDGSGRLGRDRPAVTAGLAHGRESLYWYYFVDARYRHHLAEDGSRPGDRLFVDVAPGWRPYLGELEQTDTVLFLEFNYVHVFPARVAGQDVPGTGGDYLFVAPEILLSPHNRLMFKAGLQVPLVQAVDGPDMESRTTFVLETEIRF